MDNTQDKNAPSEIVPAGQGTVIGQVQVRAIHGENLPKYYANLANVSHTPFDVCIDFCLASPPQQLKRVGDNIEMHVPVVVQIIIPPDLATALSQMLLSSIGNQDIGKEQGLGEIELSSENPIERFSKEG